MKQFFLALLIAVLSCWTYIPLLFICDSFSNSSLALMFFLVFVVSFATMIILKRIQKNHKALMERLDELEKQIKNKDLTD